MTRVGVLPLHAYLGHADVLTASRQRGHAFSGDLVPAAFRAEQRPPGSVRCGPVSGEAAATPAAGGVALSDLVLATRPDLS
jgi:hypothetical protein